MRHYKRAETVDGKVDTRALEEVGLSEASAQEMYRYRRLLITKIALWCRAAIVNWRVTHSRRKAVVALPSAMVATGLIPFNLFNSRRIDAVDVTSKTEPHA